MRRVASNFALSISQVMVLRYGIFVGGRSTIIVSQRQKQSSSGVAQFAEPHLSSFCLTPQVPETSHHQHEQHMCVRIAHSEAIGMQTDC